MLAQQDYELLLDRFDRSAVRLPFVDKDSVVSRYLDPTAPVFPAARMGERLRYILASDDVTRFDTHDVRKAVAAQLIGGAIGEPSRWADELHHVASYFGGGSGLLPPTDDLWDEAADLGRALFVLSGHAIADTKLRWPKDTATAEAAGRLRARGIALTMTGAELIVTEEQLAIATGMLQALLDELGFVDVAGNLLRVMRERSLCIDGIYIAGRQPDVMRTEPSTPYNLLLQLAARSSAHGELLPAASRREPVWGEAVELVTDIAAVLEIEPHGLQVAFERRSSRLIPLLREIGLFDALFSFRQWPLEHSGFMLSAFYAGLDDSALKAAANWGIADALHLFDAVSRLSSDDPSYFDRARLASAGADATTLDDLLKDLAHSLGSANAAMNSPTAQADLMFRPLLEVEPGVYTQVAGSLAGPAFFEAIQSRLRGALPGSAVSKLLGDGTERVVVALFARAGMTPVATGLEYDMGTAAKGECDLVFADDERILFVETKAKAVSRATQTGHGHAALLDFGGGMLAAQLQGIGHERVLRAHGRLDFTDGSVLALNGRAVSRVSVTLLDHAGLQDRLLVRTLLRTLLNMEFGTDGADSNVAKQVNKLNKVLRKADADVRALDAAGAGAKVPHSGGSISVGHLAVMLADGVAAGSPALLGDLVGCLAPMPTYGLLNPFSEYLLSRKSRLQS